MILCRLVILALRGLDKESKLRMAKSIGISQNSFYRYLQENSEQLTKASVLNEIRNELQLPVEFELLEQAKA